LTGCKLPNLYPVSRTMGLLLGEVCSHKEAELIICGVWSLWMGSNARRHGRKHWNPSAAVRHVAAMVEDVVCLEEKIDEVPHIRKGN
jgi:hypothetical protein